MPVSRVVLAPCLLALLWGLFVASEMVLWRVSDHYPALFAGVRYVDDITLLTPQAMADICRLPLSRPELQQKRSRLFLRCGTPGFEGVYRIEIWAGGEER
ncbi:hypothetical protein [Shimwellia blattae]|uniref:Uncharacterized protein n=1 Tax=Shimwellia blattae (strain ATCC 29907 / DSM 4481 / JCM 1650 / NBRC 105725 / CDC 9005-74) TaxID=630626 RepID=I2B6T6_SHIBC|nr:hypothetical protein [Shimwellia blattae]AFJ46240.1 hypothetical protein EBL_c11360 [Shimwellia blattae DSM 4481 = NBRC 105725]VDY63705.1 Uncharacterised protein [Shimwellia blattae]VEC21843.1 Uncharacterised protein [Shimwellia blattae]